MISSFVKTKVALILFFVFSYCYAQAQITSNFSSNDDGWTVFDNNSGLTSAVSYSSTGGNPGGYISFSTTATYVPIYFRAPSKFTGNQSFAYNQNLTFDLKVSTAGTDNSAGDVIIISPYGNLYYQLPSKPVTAAWSSYSVQLNESNFHNGYPGCLVPSQVVMKQVLSNVTNLQIRLKYLATTGGAYISQLDNVVLNTVALGNSPTITTFTPQSGLAGSTVTITGTNFNAVPSQNSVFFNGTKATITNASSTQLTVKVPASAAYGSITVVNNGTQLQAKSVQKFNPLFNNNSDFGGRIISSTLTPGYFNILQTGTESYNGFGGIDKGDLDGDGLVDLIVTDTGVPKIIAYRNLGVSGLVTASSFSSAITLPSLSTVPGGGPSLSKVMIVDVDCDGKLDVAASTAGNLSSGTSFLAVFLNTSTPGVISFSNPVFFAYPYYSALTMAAGDLDSDGRVDFAFTTGNSPGNVWVVQNTSSPGIVDFAYGVGVGTSVAHSDIAIEDLNNDSKPELLVSTGGGIEIYQNNSSVGTINLNSPFTISVSSGSYISVADLDADNKPDLMWSGYGSGFIYYSQNIFSGSTFNSSSFGAPIGISSKLTNPDGLAASDINGDGKPEIVIVGSSDVGIMQNVGATGALSSTSFTSPVIFQGSASGAYLYGFGPTIADFNGDNKAEVAFIYANNAVPNSEKGLYIFNNESFQAPQIAAVNPSSAPSGSTVTVTGNYLNTKNDIPQVSGIGIISSATNVSNTSLQINAPTGFADNRIAATLHGLQAFSPTQFYTQLNGGLGGAINSSTFGTSVDYVLSAFVSNPGLAVADLDSDGKPDIVIDDNGAAKIYANTLSTAGTSVVSSSFTLQASTLNSASHLKVSDLDGDGILDVITNYGFFAGKGISPSPISFSASANTPVNNTNRILVNHDFNLDGKPEVVTSTTSNQILVYENFTNKGAPFVYSGALASLSNSPLTYSNGGTVIGLVAADFDGDGFEDIAYGVNTATSSLSVLLNSGTKQIMTSSQFSGPTTFTALSNPQYVAVADFNSDGKMDVAMGYYTTSLFISVFTNTSTIGNLNFTRQDLAAPANCTGVEVGDIDGDGKPEIVTINNPSGSSGSFSIFRNTSSGGSSAFASAVTYSLSSPSVPNILALADVNLDNKTDIIIARTGPSGARLSIFQNFITFPSISISSQPASTYSVCDGATPVISTSATGTTNITYQWQIFNSGSGTYSDLTNTGGYSNVSTPSLTINSTGNFGNGTYRCKIDGDFATSVYTNSVSFTVNTLPSAPTAQDVNNCGPGSVTLNASGGNNGQFFWYDQNGLITGQTNSSYSTPVISSTTPYSVAVTDGTCVSAKTNVNAVILSLPAAPSTQDANACPNSQFILSASGGTNGEYRRYTVPTGGSAIAGEVNNTYTTPSLSNTTTYYVAINNGSCESTRAAVSAIVLTSGCNPPTIDTTPLATQIGGKITLNLVPLIVTSNNNLDLNSLQIVVPPSSGASASIDVNGVLTIDYTGLSFSGTDQLTLRACDTNQNCAQQIFSVNVTGDIEVFNGISPNGVNPKLIIQYIDVLPDTKNNTVSIYDRWENLVWQGSNYDNSSVVFTGTSTSGNALPSGVYFYKIEFASSRNTKTGFISLRRQ